MRRADKAARILATLESLYPTPAIPLQHADPFTLLVAVVLSAQTTDKKVNQVTPRLFARAATPQALAELSVAEIRERFKRAKREGDLPADADPAVLARFLATVIEGMAVQAASGATRKELERVAETALLAFPS